jgi:peptidoglycan/xylan/chitin deacetylase (PgdA/CDA1 family)
VSSGFLRSGIHRIALVSGASTLRARLQGAARILTFHGIDEEYSVELFESQIRYLLRHFTIVPLGSILDWLDRRRPTPKRPIALTFDDGLRNQCSNAYPVLRRLGAPATFYVCPGLIEERRWLWNHEARARLRSLTHDARRELGESLPAGASGIEEIISWMKSIPLKERESAEGAIRAASKGWAPTPALRDRYDVMSWEEIASLDPGIITIGSHTSNHPILTSLDPRDAATEISESARWLEQRLGRPIEHFCYPGGAANDQVVEMARGRYRTAVSTRPGLLAPGDDPHTLKRVHCASSLERLAWRLHRPTA